MRAYALPWLVLSTAAHATLALALRGPPAPTRLRPPEARDVVELAIETRVQADEAEPSPPAPVASTPVSTRPRGRASRAHSSVPRETPAPARTQAADAPAREATPTLPSLSPRAVAQAAVDAEPASDAGVAPRPPTAEERLNHAIAAGVPSHVDTIPDPVLERGPKGGYVYQGRGFDAIIRPDGRVEMRDRFGTFILPLVPFRTPDGKWHVPLGLGGTFKLFEWLDRKLGKNDPFQSERRWFLERTRPLREKLELDHYGKASGLGATPAP